MSEWEITYQNDGEHGAKSIRLGKKETLLWGFIPVLTDRSGLYLNKQDLGLIGFEMAAFNLAQLLIKPGESLCREIASLEQFSGWSGLSIVNGHFPSDIDYHYKNEQYAFQSNIDGRKLHLTTAKSIELALAMKPDVLLPSIMLSKLKDKEWVAVNEQVKNTTLPMLIDVCLAEQSTLLAADDQLGFCYDAYHAKDIPASLEILRQQSKKYRSHVHYIMGNMTVKQMLTALINGADIVETPVPANDAINGILYTDEEIINISDKEYESDFQPIDEECECYTCKNFTRAYLHHLHVQTPLLSYRLQIIHNLYYCYSLTMQLREFSQRGKLRDFINTYMM